MENGAQLLVLPELYSCGYNVGERLIEMGEPSDGPTAQEIAEIARDKGVAIHYGYAEAADGVTYNSAQCVGPDGGILGQHRKLAIPPGFERDIFEPGRGCSLFSFRGFKVAMLTCYDAEFAPTVRHVAQMGADLVLVPTALGADWGWVAQTMIPTRAFENGIFLAYANSAGSENGLEYLGQSLVAAPDGQILARAGKGPETLYADLDLGLVAKAQSRLPYLVDGEALRLT